MITLIRNATNNATRKFLYRFCQSTSSGELGAVLYGANLRHNEGKAEMNPVDNANRCYNSSALISRPRISVIRVIEIVGTCDWVVEARSVHFLKHTHVEENCKIGQDEYTREGPERTLLLSEHVDVCDSEGRYKDVLLR